MDNVTVYMETVYNSSNSMNLTRNLNKNRKKSNVRVNTNESVCEAYQAGQLSVEYWMGFE